MRRGNRTRGFVGVSGGTIVPAFIALALIVVTLVACAPTPHSLSAPGVTAEFSEQAARNQQLYAPPSEPLRASFVAVGDNLIHGSIYRTHATGDGGYSFDDIYAPVKEAIEAADVAYINQETVCGGTELGLADYPCFNSPHQILDALSNAGFDWLNTASNHSMDVGEAGILSQLAYLETLPNLTETGTHASAEAAAPTIIEAGGIRVGLASYTYGLNGFILPEGKDYLVNLIDWDGIARDIGALAQASDVQIVSMHWGAEYRHTPTDEQVALAQYLSDLGVDVVIGAHPHVVEPTTMITGEQGNRTLVIYSLGNFLSAQDEPPRMLGEMASWTITYNPHSGEVGIENVEILPTVTHIYAGYSGFEIYLLRDYTDALASQHLLAHQGLTRDYLVGLANDVFGGEFPVIY